MNLFLQVINDILPRLAKKKMDAIIAESQDAQFKLDFVPTGTNEYVNSLTFLEEIQKRVRIKSEPWPIKKFCGDLKAQYVRVLD